jgi:hypothetical protein
MIQELADQPKVKKTMPPIKRHPPDKHWSRTCSAHFHRSERDLEVWNELIASAPKEISETALISDGIYLLQYCLHAGVILKFSRTIENKNLEVPETALVKVPEFVKSLLHEWNNQSTSKTRKKYSKKTLHFSPFMLCWIRDIGALLAISETKTDEIESKGKLRPNLNAPSYGTIIRIVLHLLNSIRERFLAGWQLQLIKHDGVGDGYLITSLPTVIIQSVLAPWHKNEALSVSMIARLRDLRDEKNADKKLRLLKEWRGSSGRPEKTLLLHFWRFIKDRNHAGITLAQRFYPVVFHSGICSLFSDVITITAQGEVRFNFASYGFHCANYLKWKHTKSVGNMIFDIISACDYDYELELFNTKNNQS